MVHKTFAFWIISRLCGPHSLVQLFVVVIHRFPLLSFDFLDKSWQRQANPRRLAEAPSMVLHMVVSMNVRRAPSSSALNVSSSTSFSDASGKSAESFGSGTWKDSVDCVSCSSLFRHKCRKLEELEPFFSAFNVAHVQGPLRFTDRTRNKTGVPQLLFFWTRTR